MAPHDIAEREFTFAFATCYRLPALLFGITPGTTHVKVGHDELRVRFGPWRLHTPLTNIAGCEETGDFSFLKTAGPARLSLADRGITFATNGDWAACIRFCQPVPGIDRSGRLLHPGATITVAHPPALIEAIESPLSPGPLP